MKIKPKKKLYAAAPKETQSSGVASWAITDPSKFKQVAVQAKSDGLRAPEFWLKDGDRKQIRFLDKDAVASFRVYNQKVGGKWHKFVAPPEGETDLFASALGLRSQPMFVFRIIDIEGYTPTKGKNAGKPVKNAPRFYVVGARVYEQIRAMVEVTGQDLNDGNVVACRSGTGTNTAYTFIPRPGILSPAMKEVRLKFPKWQEFYKPVTLKQQREAVALLGGGDPSEED